MVHAALPAYIRYLQEPGSYHHGVAGKVELLQTHISYVLLAGEYVYKWKKPVNLRFLDFSTLARRQVYCHRELELNRRLCPDIYLDVVSVVHEGEQLVLCDPALAKNAVEYGVKMRRLPEEGMMVHLVNDKTLSCGHLDDLVAVLLPFYQHAAGDAEVVRYGEQQEIARKIEENFAQTEEYIGSRALPSKRFLNIAAYARGILADSQLFQQRQEAGRIRDCHGDLHSANICFGEKTWVFDCIEFNESLRCGDVAADIAFLAMDLDYFGLSTLSDYFVARYVALSGDSELAEVLNFYKCYRAYVRGKVGLLTSSDPQVEPGVATEALARATSYFKLAERYTTI